MSHVGGLAVVLLTLLMPIPDHPPVTVSGVVKGFDAETHILDLEDGRRVKLTAESKVVRPAAGRVRAGDLIVVQDVLPVGVQSGAKALAVGQPQRMATVAAVDETTGLVRLTDGTAVRVASSTNLHLGAIGSSTVLTDLKPGDEVVIVLSGPDPTPVSDAASALPRPDVTEVAEAVDRKSG